MIFDRRRYARDNYTYLLAEGADAALVDPGDPQVALALAAAHGARPRWILHTHGHADHTGGTAEVKATLSAQVVGSAADAWGFPVDLDAGSTPELRLGALRLAVHPAPGHTPGSLLYAWEGRLLTGDTLFWGGAGNCKSRGDPRALARTFIEVIGRLPGDLLVHPGHDYAESNLPFALALEPENGAAAAQLAGARAAHGRGEEPTPTTLDDERRSNPFLRAWALAPVLGSRGRAPADPYDAVVAVRWLKDGWRG